MTPSWVIVKMAAACALADPAEVIEKGAIPPVMWQPAHLAAKIGATSFQVGTACFVGVAVELVPRAAKAPTAAKTAIAAATAARRRLRLTDKTVAGTPSGRGRRKPRLLAARCSLLGCHQKRPAGLPFGGSGLLASFQWDSSLV